MEFAKGMYDLKGKTIKEMRMGEFSDMAIFVTEDNMVMIVEYALRGDDDSYEDIGGKLLNKFRVQRYLMDNRGIREWLFNLGVINKEELDNYEVLIREQAAKEVEKRKQQEIENDKVRLKQLMERYPDLVKANLEENKA